MRWTPEQLSMQMIFFPEEGLWAFFNMSLTVQNRVTPQHRVGFYFYLDSDYWAGLTSPMRVQCAIEDEGGYEDYEVWKQVWKSLIEQAKRGKANG